MGPPNITFQSGKSGGTQIGCGPNSGNIGKRWTANRIWIPYEFIQSDMITNGQISSDVCMYKDMKTYDKRNKADLIRGP